MSNQSIEALTDYCLAKPGSFFSYPFGEGTRVFKVIDRVYGFMGEDNDPLTFTLKCDPEDAQALRAQYPAIQPGYHTNKEHWNTLTMDGSLPDALVHELIDHSYNLIVAKFSAAKQKKLRALGK